jgi:hypothetical protein
MRAHACKEHATLRIESGVANFGFSLMPWRPFLFPWLVKGSVTAH